MVQKLVRLATAPKTNARTKPPMQTASPGFEVPPKETIFREQGRLSYLRYRVGSARPAVANPSRRRRHESHWPQARPSASAL